MNTTPANDTSLPVTAAITVSEIRAKDWTRHGIRHQGKVTEGHHAEIVPGRSIRLFGTVAAGSRYVRNESGRMVSCEQHPYQRDFVVGDVAEYSSYNLSYTGTIRSITAKTVTIVA